MALLLMFLVILIVLRLNINKKITSQTGNDGKKRRSNNGANNFCRTREMLLINCEINFSLTWFENCIIVAGEYDNQQSKIAIYDTKRYVPVVTLSAEDNEKILQQLEICFKRTINLNKYQSEPKYMDKIDI